MRKLSAFLTIFLLALASVTYLYYNHWCSSQQIEERTPYVPKSAALVYTISDLGKQWEDFQQTPIGAILSQVPALTATQHSLTFLQHLIEAPGSLDKVPLTISFHDLGEEHLGCIFYLDMHNTAAQELFKTVTQKVQQDKAYNRVVRNYAGCKIIELSKRDTTQTLVYIEKDRYIIASDSSLLIEDVIRELNRKNQPGLRSFKRTDNKLGSLYINFSQMPQLLRVFIKHNLVDNVGTALATLAPASHLNLKLASHHLLLGGFAKDDTTTSLYLVNTLHGQTAGAMSLASYLPKDMAMLQHFTFSDAEQFIAAWQQYRKQPEKGKVPEIPDMSLLGSTLCPLLQGEIGCCTLATQQGQEANKLVFIKTKDPHTFMETLKGCNLLTLPQPQKQHQPTNIYQLATDYFQHWLPGLLFSSFSAHYITQVDDYVILANNQIGLRKWRSQYRQGETGIKTSPQEVWFSSILEQTQLSLLADIGKMWPQIIQSLKPAWKKVLEAHASTFKEFKVAFQLLHEEDAGCYMSVLLSHLEQSPVQAHQETVSQGKVATISTIFASEAPIISQPWLVRSHRSKGYYTLLQDARYQLYFLDPKGKLLWQKTLEGPITTHPITVDYYKNNKTQYLLATNQRLHLLDYYGHEVSRYPHTLPHPDQPIRLRVVDYSHSKQYRFLIATTQGNIYLKDKYYQPLPDWNPRALGKDFADTPLHLRAQGKDYFLVLQTDGTLQALNRRGESYPGFPVKLKEHTHNPLLVRPGNTADKTSLTVFTDTGQRIDLNLAGQIQKAVQLERSHDTSSFTLCPNHAAGHQYIIMRQDRDRVVMMNEEGNFLFELQHEAQNLLLQYYHFGDNCQFYVLTDRDRQLTYLYDHTGKLLQDTPWHNGHEVSLLFSESEKRLQVYVSCHTTLSKYMLPY